MKKLLLMFLVATLLVACGETKTETTEKSKVITLSLDSGKVKADIKTVAPEKTKTEDMSVNTASVNQSETTEVTSVTSTFFIFGSFWFWLLVIATFIALSILVNKERSSGTLATCTLLAFAGIFFYFGNQDLFYDLVSYIKDHPLGFTGWVFGYLLCGVIWAIFKWYFFLLEVKNNYLERKEKYSNTILVIPSAKEYKATIIMWMSYWVVSIYWTLIKEFVTGIWDNIHKKIGGLLDWMSSKVFKDVIELKEKEDAEKKAEAERKADSTSEKKDSKK